MSFDGATLKRWYEVAVFGFLAVLLVPFTYLAGHGIAALFFFSGLLLLGYARFFSEKWSLVWPLVGLSALVIFRSDFVQYLVTGKGVVEAFTASNQLFLTTPILFVCLMTTYLCLEKQDDATSVTTRKVFIFCLGVFCALMALEAISFSHLYDFWRTTLYHSNRPDMNDVFLSNANTCLILWFWPIAAFLAKKNLWVWIILLAIFMMIIALAVDTNVHLVAFAGGLAVFFAVVFWPKGFKFTPNKALAVAATAFVVAFPLLILGLNQLGVFGTSDAPIPASWEERLKIWSFSGEKIMEKPIWGWGMESSRYFADMPMSHPHNMSLQAWLELGVLGLVFLSIFWFKLFSAIKSNPDDKASFETFIQPFALAGASTFFIINALSYGLWRSWLFCAAAFMAMLFVMVRRHLSATDKVTN